ncbi:MAG: hypothetical protein K2N65_04525, partial [Anaeroplasmataceae bacterium]|nr:hypothetical protein [Anaeroplasmataceae bacterium]
TMYYYCLDTDSKAMINNVLNMFTDENKYKKEMEAAYDALTEALTSSQLLDVVFKSSLVGKQIDKLVVTITKQEDAKIPRDIDYVGKQGECAILLESLKILLKNDGGHFISTMLESEEGLSAESITGLVKVFTKEIEYENQETSLIKVILKSKMLYYMLSAYLTYAEFGAFKLYLSPDSVETIEDTQVIKRTEIDNIADLITNCSDLIINIIEDPNNLDYANMLSNEYIRSTAEHSLLLQGTLSNVIIGIAEEQGLIVLPIGYDNPEEWISITQPNPEIMRLLNAVFDLSQEKTEEGSYIINDLLNGSISPKVLLNLERKTIQTICKSKVLRYTVSDMVTDLGDTNFQIVVAYTSLETPNALTTTDKKVNVVKAEELSEIFIDIQTIILFDENDNIKINYNAIFKNKMEISQNKTIAATLIQAMYDNNEEGFLIIPENYTEDFDKIKTEENLEGNAWFGNIGNVLDDELYLMLNAVETLIDKDENGNIPNDFDFNTIQNDLKLRENCIDVICASVIMNASISNQVTKKFYVPTSSYGNQVILDKELDSLFNAVFKMFDKTEIPLADLNDDLFNLMFRKDAIPIILNSKILVSTISKRMSNIDEIDIPRSVTTDTLYVEREEDGFIVHTSELDQLFTAMFVIFDTDTIMVNDMQQHLTGLELSKDSVDSITNSSILRATISTRLAEANQTVILEDNVELEELVNFILIGSIRKEELVRFLNGIFLIIHNDKIVIDEINQQMSSIVLSKEDISTILQSDILHSTISNKVTKNDELVVPVSTTTSKLAIDGTWKNILNKDELNALIDAMFVLLNTENIEINALNTSLQTLILNQSKIDAALQSVVLQATISNNFINAESLTIPHIVLEPFYTIQYEEKEKIVYEELIALFAAIFATTDTISGKNFDLAEMALPTEQAQAESMVQSIIVSATLSNNITTQDSIVKVVDELRTNYFLNGQISIETYIDQQELASLLLALTNGLGKSNPKDLSIEDIHVPKTDAEKQALIGSEIIRTTISEKVLNQSSTYISSN